MIIVYVVPLLIAMLIIGIMKIIEKRKESSLKLDNI